MNKGFRFIDGTKKDRLTRRLARSHAMKGKNIGKTHHRRSKLGPDQLRKTRQLALQVSNSRKDEDSSRSVYGSFSFSYNAMDDQLLPILFPVDVTSQSRDIINQFFTLVLKSLYPSQLCLSLDQTESYWFRVLFMDAISYHCSVALMATLNAFCFGEEFVSSKAIYHLNQAVRMVNQKLQTEETLSNSTLSVVNFMIVQQVVREVQPEAEIHLKGLKKMVELRGGLSQLEEDSQLALKICKTELDYALHYGTSIHFYRDRMANVTRTLASEGFSLNKITPDARLGQINPFLHQILVDVTNVAHLFNTEYMAHKIDSEMLQEIIVSVGCRLVRFHPLGEPRLEHEQESAYHIGLTAFMTTFFLQFGRRRFLKYGLVGQCLKDVIDRGLEDSYLMLWLLFIGGVSVLAEVDDIWLYSRIHQVTQLLGIEDWATLHQLLVQFPWINSLHGENGKILWDSVMSQKRASQIVQTSSKAD